VDSQATRTPRRHSAAPRKGDLREQAILDAAERLLADPGYDAMTMADIATGSGITRGALYFYFGSKQDVVTGLITRTVRALHEKSRAAGDDTADPRAAIETAMRRTADIWLEHGLVMRAAIDLSPSIPAVSEQWSETAVIFIRAITTVLERAGIPAGIRPGEAAAMAGPICWMIERSFYHASRVSPDELERTSATCQDLWLRIAGLGNESA
jgi:TetR/AcrR family transcriptional regulator, ethionamide resistance regulator